MATLVAPGSAALAPTTGGSQSYEERLREGAYTAPSGRRLTFQFVDLSRIVKLRGTAWEFPDVNDAYVQRTGFGARRYPLACYFTGKDHDLIATAFEASLLEEGPGRLEHPIAGPLTVVPFEEATRRNDLVRAANQTVVEVTFWTTLGAVYPSSRADPQNEILAAIVGFDAAAAQRFKSGTDLRDTLKKSAAKATVQSIQKSITNSLASVAAASESVAREFDEAQRSVASSLNVLLDTPDELAKQLTRIIKVPGQVVGAIEGTLDAFENFVDAIVNSKAGRPAVALAAGSVIVSRTERIANDFHLADLSATSAVLGAITAVTNHTFATKPEALIAAERIQALFDLVVAWRDECFAALGEVPELGTLQVDTGESYQAAEQAVSLTIGLLVQVSFQVVPEKTIELARARTIIDLAAELYGSVDDKLDFLINSNNLTGSDILELQAGRKIKYYPPAA